jgi:hypothetical protein
MTDEKLIELVRMLTIRTTESKLHWIKTGPESKYGLEFSNGRISIESWINKGKKYVNFSIFNKDGYKIEEYKFNDQTESRWFDLVSKLYMAIEKKFLEFDTTVNMILDELK